ATASTNNQKFTTYQHDQESGLDYAMNRYYASPTGRMLSVDLGPTTRRIPQSLNRYAYTVNDPINHTDSTGDSTYIFIPFPRSPSDDQPNCLHIFITALAGPQAPDCPISYLSPIVMRVPVTASEAQPECFAQLKYRPVEGELGEKLGVNH